LAGRITDWLRIADRAATLRPSREPRYLPAVTIRLGIVGCGSFSRSFIPLFNAHPLVNGVVLCDVDADKLAAQCAGKHVYSAVPTGITQPKIGDLVGAVETSGRV